MVSAEQAVQVRARRLLELQAYVGGLSKKEIGERFCVTSETVRKDILLFEKEAATRKFRHAHGRSPRGSEAETEVLEVLESSDLFLLLIEKLAAGSVRPTPPDWAAEIYACERRGR